MQEDLLKEASYYIDNVLFESAQQNIIAIYPGRFQPFHINHFDAWKTFSSKFKNSFIATSNTTGPKSPLKFNDKKTIITKMFGIPSAKIVNVKNPYRAEEIVSKFDANKWSLVFAVGKKDAERLGSGKYFRPYKSGEKLLPLSEAGYYFIIPHKQNSFNGKLIDGTLVRSIFSSDNEQDKVDLFKLLYGKFDKTIFNLLVDKIGINESITKFLKWNLLESSRNNAGNVDDGPGTWYKNEKEWKKTISRKVNKWGYEIVSYLIDSVDEIDVDTEYPRGPVDSVSFGPAGIGGTMTATNRTNLSGLLASAKWRTHIKKMINKLGYEFLRWEDAKGFITEAKQVKNEEYINENTGMVKCKICKKWMKQIQYNHLKCRHNGMTINEYKSIFPDAPLIAESAKNVGNNNPMSKQINKEKHLKSVTTDEYREKQRIGSTGRKHTKESKLKMSKNNAMHNEEHRNKVKVAVKESYVKNKNLKKIRSDFFKNNSNARDALRQKNYNSGKWTRPELKDSFTLYTEQVRNLTQINYSKYINEIPNARLRSREYHLDHKYSIYNGFKNNIPIEVIAHYKNLRIIYHSINESKFTKNSITLNNLLIDIKNSKDPLNSKILLLCGGAAGHMAHPFDDNQLRFIDIKTMIELGLEGKLQNAVEKSDGQNAFISVTDRGVVLARNKGHLKNFGKEALDINGVKQTFSGRGPVEDAFVFMIKDLNSQLNNNTIKKELENGKYWINIEIIYPPTTNVILYDTNLLIFHNVVEVGEDGEKKGIHKKSDAKIKKIIDNVNKSVNTKFGITTNKPLTLSKVSDFSKKKKYFVNKLDGLRKRYKLGWDDRLIKFHWAQWDEIISTKEQELNYFLTSKARNELMNRWVYGNKGFAITKFKDIVDNEVMLKWIRDFDKKNHADQLKKNLEPLEMLILEWGIEILKNMKEFISVNPEKTLDSIKNELGGAIKTLTSSKDVKDVNKVNDLINKIQALGGMESVVPAEGLVFMYKGNIYKITGAFAKINQLLGILKFGN